MILNTLKNLENTASTNAKVEILIDDDSPLLRRVLYMALNKYLRYGFQSIPAPIPYVTTDNMLLTEALDFVENRLTGNQRSKSRALLLATVLARLSSDDAEVLERVVLKDVKCGIGRSLVNKAYSKLIPEFKVLLAKPGKEKNLKNLRYPAMAQIKYDGARSNFDIDDSGNIEAFTRNGNLMSLHGRFDGAFPDSANGNMVDGELVAFDKFGNKIPRKLSNGIVTKATRGTLTKEDVSRMKFVVWDIVNRENFKNQIPEDTPCNVRYAKVKQLLEGYSDLIEVAESRIVNSFEEAQNYYEECVENGEEGIIIKNIDGIWELKRSNNLVKMKAEEDADLVIVGLNEGKGSRKGKLGSFALQTSDGLLEVNCGTGLSNAQTEEYWDTSLIGKIVAVTYNEQIDGVRKDTKSLFLPVFKSIRYDKDVANSLSELV